MDKRLMRKKDETGFEHIKRIVYGKLIDKTIKDNYEDLSELVFGEGNCYNESEVRKRFYGIKRLLEVFDEESINIQDKDKKLNELNIKIIELEKERKKIQATKIEYNRMLRNQSRNELIIEEIRDVIPTIKTPEFNTIFNQTNNKKEFILSFGDIHYDKFFESVNNLYSIEEIHRRFQVLLEETVKVINKEHITKLTVINCGDSIQGLLRISDLKTLKLGLIDSVIEFSRFMGEWLNTLSKYVFIDYLHVPTANHSEIRMFNQKARETDENLERLIINYIHDLLKNNERINIPITIDKDYIDFSLLGYNFIALHGDKIKNIKSSLKDLSMLHKKFYDYVIMGHYHSGLETTVYEGNTNNMEVLIVPSVIGSDKYSDSLMVGSKSSAKIFGFEEGKGKTISYNIILN